MSKNKPVVGDTVCVHNERTIRGTITEIEIDAGNHIVKVLWEDGKFPEEWWHYEKELNFIKSA